MPPRRKSAPDASTSAAPATSSRPRTRSQKPALEVPASPPPPPKRRGRPPGAKPAGSSNSSGQAKRTVATSSSTRSKARGNDTQLVVEPIEEVSEDELNISPSKRRSTKDTSSTAATKTEPKKKPRARAPATRGRRKLEEADDDQNPEVVPLQTPSSPSKRTRATENPPTTPAKRRTPSPTRSPAKRMKLTHAPESLSKLPRVLPKELHESLDAQKAAVLVALQHLPMQQPRADEEDEDEEAPANELTLQQLDDLLRGTVERGEGNSCLLIGPRSSGKTRIVETALASQSQKPIVIRLSGHVQTTDRLAMREIARQAAQQTGSSFSADAEVDGVADEDDDVPVALPPSSHLPALISTLPTLKRPTVIILEAFDLFALHPRQALLYCLLDTAQSCRVGDDMKGVAVIGVTTRVDTINLLEKRVKSRFSGRMLRTASPRRLTDYIAVARGALTTPPPDNIKAEEWSPLWNKAVEQFLADRATREIFNETFALTRDVSVLSRILTATIVGLTPLNPFPTAVQLTSAVAEQRCPPRLSFLQSLSYPCMCLLIAATHARTSGHDAFTFEMLHETFRDQVRTSLSAPVQVEGGGIGMMKCTREVLLAAFEYMIRVRAFVMSGPSSSNVAKEFGKYRCMAEREEVKKIVDRLGQTNLKKWFSKAK